MDDLGGPSGDIRITGVKGQRPYLDAGHSIGKTGNEIARTWPRRRGRRSTGPPSTRTHTRSTRGCAR
eukprot:532430-Pyramimonas_sp.AAC.1